MRKSLTWITGALLLAGCAGGGGGESTTTESASTPPAASATSATSVATATSESSATTNGPSREGLLKSMADSWGALTDAEKADLCVAFDDLGGDGVWGSLGSPDSLTPTELDLIWADYCRDY